MWRHHTAEFPSVKAQGGDPAPSPPKEASGRATSHAPRPNGRSRGRANEGQGCSRIPPQSAWPNPLRSARKAIS
jgi:hypothetical protein